MKKRQPTKTKKPTLIAIVIGIIIIGLVIIFNYNLDQAKLSGQQFGDNLAQIQSDLKNEVTDYQAKLTLFENGNITKNQMLQFSDNHLTALNNTLSKYNTLKPPQPFAPSLELFKLSTQTELDSDKFLKKWIETGDNASKVRSDELLQQSFEYETSALESYNKAKASSP